MVHNSIVRSQIVGCDKITVPKVLLVVTAVLGSNVETDGRLVIRWTVVSALSMAVAEQAGAILATMRFRNERGLDGRAEIPGILPVDFWVCIAQHFMAGKRAER